MSEYVTAYRCQLCGEVVETGTPLGGTQELAIQTVEKVIKNQVFAGNPYLHQAPMYVMHRCNDGSAGLAVFAGFRKVGE